MSATVAGPRILRVMVSLTAFLVGGASISAQDVARFAANSPTGIVSGPGGAVWFADQGLRSIRRVDSDGSVQEFPVNGSPQSLAAGADGNLWYTLMSPARIGRMTTDGTIREFALPTPGVQPQSIVAGPDGALWFAESNAYRLGRITTSGSVSELPELPTRSWIGRIAADAEGNLWFTQPQAFRIGRTTPAGVVSEFVLTSGEFPIDLAIGADGDLRYLATLDGQPARVGRIARNGDLEERPVPAWFVDRILTAADGSVWIAGYGTFGRLLADGTVANYAADGIYSSVRDLVRGPDGSIWVAIDTDGWGTPGSVLRYSFDTSPCVPDASTLCLGGGRFRVTVSWEAVGGASGSGRGVALGTSGYFWFFDPSNVELVAKVLDGCGANGHYWTFAAGLTQVGVTLNITDTATWASHTYTSAPGTPFVPVQDTSAFSTCP